MTPETSPPIGEVLEDENERESQRLTQKIWESMHEVGVQLARLEARRQGLIGQE